MATAAYIPRDACTIYLESSAVICVCRQQIKEALDGSDEDEVYAQVAKSGHTTHNITPRCCIH